MKASAVVPRKLRRLLFRRSPQDAGQPGPADTDAIRRTLENAYRTLLQSIDEGFAILEVLFEDGEPVDWVFREVNPAFARQTGLEDAVGKRARDISPNIAPYWIERYGYVVRTGEPIRFERGAPSLGNRWFDVYACRVGEPEQRLVAVLFRDTSAPKRIEQALRESEERFRLLVETSAQAVWEADPDGTISTDSPSWRAYTGQSLEEWLGHGWLEAIHPDDRAAAEACWRDAVRARERVSGEFRMRRAGGGWRWTQVEAAPLLAPDRSVRKWVGMNIDITARKTAEAERAESQEQLRRNEAALREADRRKDEFLATLAHELRSPLAPIRNGLQILKLAAGQNANVSRTMAMMERQMSQLVRLVDDLLDVSRISRGKVELQKELLLLDEVIAAALESSWGVIDSKGVELLPEIADETICVRGDFARLTQVFANLISNAVKYSEPEGKIWLTLAREGQTGVVTIRDTGAGIPAEALDAVFEMYTQAHAHAQRTGGLGIGLALARQLVQLHDGTIHARSEGIGKGSEFIVRLPLAPPGERRADTPGRPVTALMPRPLHILVADDDPDTASSIATLLELDGHTVHTAHDGPAALQAALESHPDMALLDIGMPGLDGYEVAERLRAAELSKHIHLVAVTGWGQEEDKRRSRAAGFEEHLTKPVDPLLLRRVLATLVGTNPRRVNNEGESSRDRHRGNA